MAALPTLGRRGAARPDGAGPRGPRPHLGTCDLARRPPRRLHAARDRPRGRPRAQRPVDARPRRRRSRAPADEPRRERRRRRLGRRRQRRLLPVLAQRLAAGVVPAGRRRRGDPGHAAAARRRGIPRVAARRPAGRRDRGLPGLPRPRVHPQARLEERRSAKARAQAYDRLFVRHWDTWEDGRVSQLFSIALDGERRPRGEPVPLTAALDADIPSKPHGGRADYAFSPDGSQLVFSARLRGKLEPVSTNFDVWRVPADGSGAPVNLTADNPAWDAQPAFSPDGKLLAHLAMDRPGFEADRFRLVVRDAASGAIRFTTRDWDRSIAAFRFSRGRTRDPRHRRRPRPAAAVCDRRGQPRAAQADRARERRRSSMPRAAHRLRAAEPDGARGPLPDRGPCAGAPADAGECRAARRTCGSARPNSSPSTARAARRSTATR